MVCSKIRGDAIRSGHPIVSGTRLQRLFDGSAGGGGTDDLYIPEKSANRPRVGPAARARYRACLEGPSRRSGSKSTRDGVLQVSRFRGSGWDWKTFDFDRDVERTEAKVGTVMATRPTCRLSPNSVGSSSCITGGLMSELRRKQHRLSRPRGPPARREPGEDLPPPVHRARHESLRWRGWAKRFRHAQRSRSMGRARQSTSQIVASHSTDGKVDRTRPLCPYPQIARYKGSGSTDDAANFECSRPGR